MLSLVAFCWRSANHPEPQRGVLDDEFWFQVHEKLYFHRLNVVAGLEIKYGYEDLEIKRKYCQTPPGHSHINTPSPDGLAYFHSQLELGAESLNEQAPATAIGQAVATADGWSIHFRMSKFRSSLSVSRDFPSGPPSCGTCTRHSGPTASWTVEAVVI